MLVSALWFMATWWMGSILVGLAGFDDALVPLLAVITGLLAGFWYARRLPLKAGVVAGASISTERQLS
jgi:hypothetical protein